MTNFLCLDVNECDDTDTCGANAVCTDTEGSFNCLCQTGYVMSDDGDCEGK